LSAPRLVEHFFRHEYGRLVATLSRRLGVQHLEAVEDAVQSALMTALETWTVAGLPDNPSGWLFRVAHNGLVGELRQRTRRGRILGETRPEQVGAPADAPEPFLVGEMPDDLLRMLFVCCDDGVPPESQLVLALKTLCGFDVREIALRLFSTEANVYKRLERARNRLREVPPSIDELTSEQYARACLRCTRSSTSCSRRATSRRTPRPPSARSCPTKRYDWLPSWRNIQSGRLPRPLRSSP